MRRNWIFLFTVLSRPRTATFPPTAQTTSCPYSLCLFFSFKTSLFSFSCRGNFRWMRRNWIYFYSIVLRDQRHFHQQLRRRHALIRCVCSSPLKSPFFPFYAEEIYAGCDLTEFLFTVLSPSRTATFPPTAQMTSCPYSLCLFFSF